MSKNNNLGFGNWDFIGYLKLGFEIFNKYASN